MNAPIDIDLESCSTIGEALRTAATRLAAAGVPDAAVDARHLVAHALRLDRGALLRLSEQAIDPPSRSRIAAVLLRRIAREPVSRIIGERAFHGLTLELGPETLDPRPDTETVVNVALELAAGLQATIAGPLQILDLGTGTGAIALALLGALPDAEATATDISPAALAMARRNAERHGHAERIRFVRSHWLDGVSGRYHLLVANPPYIPSAEVARLAPEVALWEPRLALDGGPDGLDAYREILANAHRVLLPTAWAVLEVGHDQATEVTVLAEEFGFEPAPADWTLLRDLGGNRRCVAAATSGRK